MTETYKLNKNTEIKEYKNRVNKSLDFIETIIEGTPERQQPRQGIMIMSMVLSKLYYLGYHKETVKEMADDAYDEFLEKEKGAKKHKDCENHEVLSVFISNGLHL